MPKPPPTGPRSNIDGLHRSAFAGDENRHKDAGTATEQMQDAHKSKGKPAQNEQKPGGERQTGRLLRCIQTGDKR